MSGCGDFLQNLKNKRIYVKLNDNSVYEGNLICIDGNLNTVLESVTLHDSMEEA